MALLMLLLIGYALLLLLPPVAVGAWGLGAERNRHSVCVDSSFFWEPGS